MKFLVLFLLVFAIPLHAAEVKNLKTGQTGDRSFATYDLAGKPGEKQAEVTVFIELGGERYAADKLALSGDYGKGVTIGVGKKVFWDVLKDMPVGFEGEALWDVEASGGGVSGSNVGATGRSPLQDTNSGVEFEKNGFKFYKDVVVDTTTGLMWARNGNIADREMNWNDAMGWAKNLNYGGYRDWRLPTKEELEAFAKRGGNRPVEWFKANGFTGFPSNGYWSSSTIANYTSGAWDVNLSSGNVYGNYKTSNYYVWPVRGGQ
jgi:hypothetical protein